MPSILADELKNDPAGKGYAAHMPDDPARVLDLLLAQTETMIAPLRSSTAKAWAARGPYARIVDASNNTSHPCRSSCLILRDTFTCGDMIHLEAPDLQAMLAAWVLTSVVTQAEADALYALASVPASRAEVLGLGEPTARDIVDAWSE